MGEGEARPLLRLFVYQMRQDDPKKCTSKKLSRLRLAKSIFHASQLSRNVVVLNPYADEVLFPGDKTLILQGGLAAIDCSWKKAEEVFSKKFRGISRRLPILLAANPVNYGHASKLSSAEALAAALYIVGFKKEAEKLMKVFKWGPVFIALNKRPLEEYRLAREREEIEKIERAYF